MKKTIISITALLALSVVAAAQKPFTPDTLGTVQAAYQNPAELLRGEIAGVRVTSADSNPAAPVSVDVRGLSTVRGDNQPLWIVDGAILENASSVDLNAFNGYPEAGKAQDINTFFHLSPYDIESIQVLKDAAATAIYGSKGAAGVIIVKTRLKKTEKDKVSLRSNVGFTGGNLSGLLKFPDLCEVAGYMHNHHINLGGGQSKSAYNISLAYRSVDYAALNLGTSDFSLKANFESKAAKFFWFGVNAIAGLGNVNTAGINIADHDDAAKRYAATASAWMRFNFAQWLDLTVTMGGDYRNVNRNFWFGTGNAIGAPLKGLASITSNAALACNAKGELSFHRYFGTYHNLTAGAAAEYTLNIDNYATLAATDYFAGELRGKGISISNSTRPLFAYKDNVSHMAFIGRLGYEFKNIAGVNATFRADKTINHFDGRFDIYPAASGWFDLRNLAFKDSKAVSFARINGGWGVTGREQMVMYPFFDNIIDVTKLPSVEKAAWNFTEGRSFQKAKEWNIGAELGFLSGRIQLEGKYFDRLVDDSFDQFVTGAPDPLENGKWKPGKTELKDTRTTTFTNRGIEGALKIVPVRNNDWTWTVKANASYILSQIKDVDARDEFFNPGYVGSGFFTANLPGRAIGSIIGYKVDADGYYVDVVPDGKITSADCVELGNLVPTVQGGVGTTLRFRQFTLDVHGDYALGFNVIDANAMKAENRTVLTSRYVSRGDYFRLSRIALSYAIPVRSQVVKGLNVSLSAHNLATFTRFAGNNPEAALFGFSPLSRGVDYNSCKMLPSFILGAQIKF